MIDDSLSDVQQEKKMSVKELRFKNSEDTFEVEKSYNSEVHIEIYNLWSDRTNGFNLDRTQAHLLMLYLQEHLK